MSNLPSKAKCVVIGAGIVGNSVAYHLARLGWRDIVQIDKGPLPNPGGSTGHASNFIFLVDHNKEMAQLTLDSLRQYKELDTFFESGGIEVARTPERMQELTRRITSGKSWGIEDMSLLTPAEVKEMVPFIDETVILGGFYTKGVGVCDSLRAGTLMREKAIEMGALQSFANVEVKDLTVEDGHIKSVVTDQGTIDADYVVIATGCWSRQLAAMAGAQIPLTPAVHQMKDIGPVAMFADAKGDLEYPIVRDMDTNMYERQHGTGLEIGSYLWARLAVLVLLGFVQCLILVVMVNSQVALKGGPFLHFVVLLAASLAGTSMGLALSAVSGTPDRAVAGVPILLLPQILFSSVILSQPHASRVTRTLQDLTFTQWSYDAQLEVAAAEPHLGSILLAVLVLVAMAVALALLAALLLDLGSRRF